MIMTMIYCLPVFWQHFSGQEHDFPSGLDFPVGTELANARLLKLAIAWSAPKVPVVLHQKTQMDLSKGERRNSPVIQASIPTETPRVTRLLVIIAG